MQKQLLKFRTFKCPYRISMAISIAIDSGIGRGYLFAVSRPFDSPALRKGKSSRPKYIPPLFMSLEGSLRIQLKQYATNRETNVLLAWN